MMTMHDDIHKAALRATAKVALSLTVAGCGARVDVVAGEPGEPGAGGRSAATSNTSSYTAAMTTGTQAVTAGSGGGGAGPICNAPDPTKSVKIDPQAFACCAELLPTQTQQAWNEPAPAVLACCHTILGQIQLDPNLVTKVDPKLLAPLGSAAGNQTCCRVLGSPCSQPCGCTVWGPPVPRAIHGLLVSLADLERLAMREVA